MKSILELEKQYQSVYGELSSTLEKFAIWLTELPDNRNLNLEYRKWVLGCDEDYESHSFYALQITITLSWTDPYSDYDSCSVIRVPEKWVDAFYKGEESSIESEVLQAYSDYNQEMLDKEKNKCRVRAIELGLIEEN